MEYEVEQLKQDVRIALDANMVSAPLIELCDHDTLSMDKLIESKLEEGARIVLSSAPINMLDSGVAFGTSGIGWRSTVGYGMGYIELPADFLRLVSFQMSDWSRPVCTAITEDDPLYARQHSRYPGVRGCPQKPVVAIVNRPAGLMLEFFSCTEGNTVHVKHAQYISMPKIEEGKIKLCERCEKAVVNYVAYLVALSVNDTDLAKNMLEIANELMK